MKAKIITNYTPNQLAIAKSNGRPIQLDGSIAYYYDGKLYMTKENPSK